MDAAEQDIRYLRQTHEGFGQTKPELLFLLILGMLFSGGRRTVSSWLRAAGVSDDWRDHYYFLQTLRRSAEGCDLLGTMKIRGISGFFAVAGA